MVELQKFLNQEEARTALSFLRANGIEAELEGQNTFSAMPHVGMGATMLRLVVPEEQAWQARTLLDDVTGGQAAIQDGDDFDYGEPEDGPVEGGGIFIRYRLVILVLLALIILAPYLLSL